MTIVQFKATVRVHMAPSPDERALITSTIYKLFLPRTVDGVLDFGIMERYKLAKIRKRRNQKKIPTPKTEVGKEQTNNQVLIP